MEALLNRMREDLRIRNYSPRTVKAYLDWIERFAHYFGRSPAELGGEEIRVRVLSSHPSKGLTWAVACGGDQEEATSL